MNDIELYDKEISGIDTVIETVAKKAWGEVQLKAKKINEKRKKQAQESNEAPCTVCKGKDYVLLYREVVGKVEGKVTGHFSLFGGSISGYVDGETHTNPVLSCRNCRNEKIVKIAEYEVDYHLLETQFPSIFPTLGIYNQADGWIKNLGIEVARKLEKFMFLPENYHRPSKFSDQELMKCGLEYKYKFPEKPFLYKLRKELF